MEKTNLKSFSVKEMEVKSLTKEQMAEGRKIMENTFKRLIWDNENDGMRWTGSLADLMELAYLTYESGSVRDAQGYPLSLAKLVQTACQRLHVRRPYNAYHTAAAARRRKGVRRHTLAERFCWLKYVAGVDNPLTAELQTGD